MWHATNDHRSHQKKGTHGVSNQQTLETVLQGYVVAIAAQNMYLRNKIAEDFDNSLRGANQFKELVENAITQDIESAKKQLPNFLKVEQIPAELEVKLRDLHIKSFFSALEADTEIGLRNLSAHFGLARTGLATGAPALSIIEGGKTPEDVVRETLAAPPEPPTPPTPPATVQ